MVKKRKLHQLTGIIKHCWTGSVTRGSYQNQPFYCLIIHQHSLFTSQKETTIYVFPNLVSTEIWKNLQQQSFKDQTYLFWCEKRVRGWRLIKCEQITPDKITDYVRNTIKNNLWTKPNQN